MILIHGANQVVTPLGSGDFAVMEKVAIAGDRTIEFIGSAEEAFARYPRAQKIDATGKVVTPGFVDPHTHLVFAGDRSSEFLMRLRGASYQEIAAAGGGILSTMKATRQADSDHLYSKAVANLQKMMQAGTTTVEVKSGYGLNWENEKKLLQVAQRIRNTSEMDVAITFLGAHDFPPEMSRDDYVREIIGVMLPEVARQGLADFNDVFCDQGYYSADQARAISSKAAELGLGVKMHVDELADVNGAALAAECNAVSADHLIFASDEGIRRMAEAGVCAVLLPGTSFSLKMKQHAPARKMINAGVTVALATDFNPGTCYCHSMHFILQLSVSLYSLTPEEALTAATLNAAAALRRQETVGSLETSKLFDCLIFAIPHYSYLFYNLGNNPVETVIKKGKILWTINQNLSST